LTEKNQVKYRYCDGIAKTKHLPSIQKLGDVEIAAFFDILPERAEEANRVY